MVFCWNISRTFAGVLGGSRDWKKAGPNRLEGPTTPSAISLESACLFYVSYFKKLNVFLERRFEERYPELPLCSIFM